jgi:cytochrome c
MKKYLLLVVGCVAVLSFSAIPQANAGPEGKCKACHDFGTKNKVGPGLKGIVGRKAGTAPGFKYSDALKNADWVWDEDHLRKWMHNSKKAIKEFTGNDKAKTKMGKQNVKGKKADKIFAFLKTI